MGLKSLCIHKFFYMNFSIKVHELPLTTHPELGAHSRFTSGCSHLLLIVPAANLLKQVIDEVQSVEPQKHNRLQAHMMMSPVSRKADDQPKHKKKTKTKT